MQKLRNKPIYNRGPLAAGTAASRVICQEVNRFRLERTGIVSVSRKQKQVDSNPDYYTGCFGGKLESVAIMPMKMGISSQYTMQDSPKIGNGDDLGWRDTQTRLRLLGLFMARLSLHIK
jgi:hypothetical protein